VQGLNGSVGSCNATSHFDVEKVVNANVPENSRAPDKVKSNSFIFGIIVIGSFWLEVLDH